MSTTETSAATGIRTVTVEIPKPSSTPSSRACSTTTRRASSTSRAAPRSWAERAYPNLIDFNEVDAGGHFAAWQEPEIFTNELRAAFKSLR
jgi:hypothetical protein